MSLYLSHKEPEDVFLKNFYLRESELELISSIIDGQSNNSLQSLLITGKRGMGKSTLLRRIAIEAKNKWKDKLILVYFGNENYKLSKLFKLWEQIILQILESESGLKELWNNIRNEKNYTALLLPFLRQILKDKKKTLLLMIDNFDQFMDQLTKKEQHELREALMETPVQIIGNCLFYTERYFKYDAPFYNFFRRIHLNRLSREETLDYFKFLAQQDHRIYKEIYPKIHAKLETMYILCGGVPRVLKILYDIFFKEKIDDAMDYLMRTLEEVTPLYQDRMRQLAPLQKEIIYEMALIWDRCSSSDLEPRLQQSTNIILNQLSILEENGYIDSHPLEGYERLKYFEIDERFFNIWILMSEASPYDERRVIWLTRWLECFYEGAELENEMQKFMVRTDIKPEYRTLFIHSSLLSDKLSEPSKLKFIRDHEMELPQEIIQAVKAKLSHKQIEKSESILMQLYELYNDEKFRDITEMYPVEYEQLLDSNQENKDWIHRIFGEAFLWQENYNQSLELHEKIDLKNGADLDSMGYIYSKLDKIKKAEKYYLLAIENGRIEALYHLANFYYNQGKQKEAEQYNLLAIENGIMQSLYNLATLYYDQGRNEEAEKYYLLAIQKGSIEAINNLAIIYLNQGRNEEAEKYYLLALQNGVLEAKWNYPTFQFKKSNTVPKETRQIALNELKYYFTINNSDKRTPILSIFYLWNERIDEAKDYLLSEISNGIDENNAEIFSESFFYCIVFHQYSFVLKLFQDHEELRDRFKVLYYVVLRKFKKEYPKEWQRMPSELDKPLQDLEAKIKSERKRLGL